MNSVLRVALLMTCELHKSLVIVGPVYITYLCTKEILRTPDQVCLVLEVPINGRIRYMVHAVETYLCRRMILVVQFPRHQGEYSLLGVIR